MKFVQIEHVKLQPDDTIVVNLKLTFRNNIEEKITVTGINWEPVFDRELPMRDPTAYLRSYGQDVSRELGQIATELDRQDVERKQRKLSWRERWTGKLK